MPARMTVKKERARAAWLAGKDKGSGEIPGGGSENRPRSGAVEDKTGRRTWARADLPSLHHRKDPG